MARINTYSRSGLWIRLSHGSILLLLLALAILMFLTASIVQGAVANSFISAAVLLTFAINAAIGIVFLVRSIAESSFSLVQMHWIFYMTMFVAAPIAQYLNGYACWGYPLSESDYLATNALVMIWGGLFALFSSLVGQKRRVERLRSAFQTQREFYESLPVVSSRAANIAFLISIVVTVVVVTVVGFENLFSRDTYSSGLDKTGALLFDKGLRPLPVFAFTLILVRAKQQKKVGPMLLVSAVPMLVADFPAAMARYNMACLYGGLALLIFRPLFEKRGLFPVLMLLAFLVLFPASNSYRTETFGVAMFVDAVVEAASNISQGFCAGDYDAYSMIARTLWYIDSAGIANGFSFLGVLLFFVPRLVWPTKPEASGTIVCAYQGQSFLDIAEPLPAEGLINFGVVGLVVFAAAAALLARAGDNWFKRSSSVIRLFHPFLCLLVFFIMRGALLSAYAFAFGYFCSFVVLMVICLGGSVVFGWRRAAERGRASISDPDGRGPAFVEV